MHSAEKSQGLRIAQIGHSDQGGGAAQAAYRIHHELNRLGQKSELWVAEKLSSDPTVRGPESKVGKLWAKVARKLDSLPKRFYHSANPSLHSPAWFGSGLLPYEKINAADIIQLHWICGGLMRVEALLRFRRPLVWRLADMWAFTGAEHFAHGSRRYEEGYRSDNRTLDESGFDLNRWVWNRKQDIYAQIPSLTIVAPSRWMADCARRSVLLRDRPIEVIHTGQDLELFRPASPQERILWRQEFGLPSDKKIILFGALSSTSDKRKGFHLLEEALAELGQSPERQDFFLAVFGSDTPFVAPQGLASKSFARIRDPRLLAKLYAAADVFVVPSIEENLANTAVEAMACGVPVVSFAVGGMPDLVRDRQNGALIAKLEAGSLRQGICSVLANPEIRLSLGQGARKTVEDDFCMRKQAEKFLHLYERILREKPRDA